MLRERDVEWSLRSDRTALTVDRVETGAQFAALRLDWETLLESSSASIFNSWSWLYPWYRRIAATRELWILTARDGLGQLQGVMPLGLERKKVLGRTVR